jgi:predicted ATPase
MNKELIYTLLFIDEASIHLISALIYSRTTMLVILTFRDGDETPQQVVDILDKCDNPVTTIQLHPLGIHVLKELVLDTLYNTHRSSVLTQYHEQDKEKQQRLETITPLVEIIYSWTRGNPFYAKQFLKTMKRKDDIWFDWNEKHWKFRLDNIKKLFDTKAQSSIAKKPTSLSVNNELLILGGAGAEQSSKSHHHHHLHQPVFDVRNLVSHLRSLHFSAQYFLMWASLIGHVFNFRRIKWLMMASPQGGDTSDDNSSTTSNSSNKLTGTSDEAGVKNGYKTSSDPSSSAYVLTFEEEEKRSNQAMLGLQIALNEGIIQYKAGNEFHFIHDRYYQAASMLISDPSQRENMHLKIGQMLMMEEEVEEDDDVFLTADHVLKSASLIRLIDKKRCYRDILTRAGNEATLSGAMQISATYYKCAFSLLDEDIEKRWTDGPDTSFEETLNVYMKLLELKLLNNKDINQGGCITSDDERQENEGHATIDIASITSSDTKFAASTTFIVEDEERDSMMKQVMDHTNDRPYERAQAWRIQARICFQQSQYRKGISNILQGLEELGIIVDTTITEEQVMSYYRAVKSSITKPGFEILMKSGPCQNTKQMAIMTLLNEACTGAYWVNPTLVDFFALKLCELSLRYGYTPASGGGFIWVGCTATRVSEFTFAAQLGKFGMALSEKYAGNSEIARAIIVHHSMLAQWTGVHVREYIYQYQRAYKYAVAGGDTVS